MGYVAVKAGEEVIERAADLVEKRRTEGDAEMVATDQLVEQFSGLVDQVTSEAGLYAPELAALAVKQSQGRATEAAFLLRAYRSTLQRWGSTETEATDGMDAERRIAPAYKDVPGGVFLGPTRDYSPKLLDFGLFDDTGDDPTAGWPEEATRGEPEADDVPPSLTPVLDLLRDEGLLYESDAPTDEEPADVTRTRYDVPAPRPALLQELARGDTGSVVALAYSALQGYGQVHPTLVELRVGNLPIRVEHPYTGEPVTVGRVRVTEAVSVVPVYEKRDDAAFAFGYGLVFGRNERKAIGMTVLDASLQLDGDHPAEDEEFVRDVVDGVDSLGYMEHMKLPHYVTFGSILDRIRSIRDREQPQSPEATDD